MAQYGYGAAPAYGGGAQNLQFYPSAFANQPVSGHSTPFQANYGAAPPAPAFPSNYGAGFTGPGGVSGQMGVNAAGLRTGWLAAFGTEGYVGVGVGARGVARSADGAQLRRRAAAACVRCCVARPGGALTVCSRRAGHQLRAHQDEGGSWHGRGASAG